MFTRSSAACFERGDDAPGAPPTVVLSYGFWQRRLGADPAILGKHLEIQGTPTAVIGVMPPGVWFPRSDVAEIWVNEVLTPPTRQGPFGWRITARIRPGVTAAQRQLALDQAAAQVRARFPGGPDQWTFVERPLMDQFTQGVRPALLVLMGAVGLVLLIACVNVTNLLLARATTREHEIAVRTSLGASRSRIVRQLLGESLVLAVLGGAGGVAIATWGMHALIAAAPDSLSALRDLDASVDGRVLLLASVVSIGCAFVFGTAPALMTAMGGTVLSIGQSTRGGTDGPGRRRVRSALVGAEFALSLVMLIMAGLLIRSLAKLHSADTGMRADGIVTASIALPTARYATPAQVLAFHDRLVAQLHAASGITAVTASVGLPPDVFGNTSDFFTVRDPVPEGSFSPVADYLCVDGDYFATLGVPLLSGRVFDTRDNANAPSTVIISAQLMHRYFEHVDPIGQRLSVGGRGPANEYTIVGVVGNVPYDGVARGGSVAMYFPFAQFSQGVSRSFSVIVRTAGDLDDAAGAVRSTVRSIDPELAVARFRKRLAEGHRYQHAARAVGRRQPHRFEPRHQVVQQHRPAAVAGIGMRHPVEHHLAAGRARRAHLDPQRHRTVVAVDEGAGGECRERLGGGVQQRLRRERAVAVRCGLADQAVQHDVAVAGVHRAGHRGERMGRARIEHDEPVELRRHDVEERPRRAGLLRQRPQRLALALHLQLAADRASPVARQAIGVAEAAGGRLVVQPLVTARQHRAPATGPTRPRGPGLPPTSRPSKKRGLCVHFQNPLSVVLEIVVPEEQVFGECVEVERVAYVRRSCRGL